MSSNKTVIAVDAMGGDLGPSVVVPGAIEAARQTGAKILLVGNEATLDGELNRLSPSGVDLEIVHAPEVAGMDEKPSDILRRKKNASIQVACRLVRDGAAQGVVSAGHSGASVACGMFIMGRIPGVERPALASLLPTEKEPVVLLDVGATVDCKPYNIFQFGLMGDAFARDILNKESPRVGLLSIGERVDAAEHPLRDDVERDIRNDEVERGGKPETEGDRETDQHSEKENREHRKDHGLAASSPASFRGPNVRIAPATAPMR